MNDPEERESLRAPLAAARAEAARLRHDFVGAEHILLGLLRDPEPAVERLLVRLELDPTALRRALEEALRPGTAPVDPAKLALRSGAKKVVGLAEAEAESMRQGPPGPEHLFLGIIRERRGVAYQALTAAGVTLERARTELARSAQRPSAPAGYRSGEAAPPGPRVVPLRGTRGLGAWLSMRRLPIVAIPASLGAYLLHDQLPAAVAWLGSPLPLFLISCVAVLPLAGYMGEATEQLAARTGPTVGGFLNATFGNAAELIIALVALRAGLVDLVKASITGSILGNLLLILGLSLVAGGMHRPVLRFNRTAAGMSAGMLALAVVALVFPAIFHAAHPEAAARASELRLSEAVAVILAATYGLSLLFSLRTHSRLFAAEPHPLDGPRWGVGKAMLVLAVATVGVAVESEILVHTTEALTARSRIFSETFLGLIVIPVIGNAAEHATAVVVARKGQIDLALQIALGSSTQVALLVAPVLVFAGVLLGTGMDLVFSPLEVAAVGLATVVAAIITLDGESHWFEGAQLLAVYALVAAATFFI